MTAPAPEFLRKAGQSLREIDPATLHPDPSEGPVRWFMGEGGTEITAWTDPAGKPHHIQLVFSRVSVEWSDKGLVTGSFENRSSTAGGRYDPYLLQLGGGVNAEVCQAALLLLEASDISEDVRAPLLTALREAIRGVAGHPPNEPPGSP